ncbi:MAG TPA: VOC family protein [Solirubrobacteraceae bacterium]|jgi:glyoxalase family protein|nr:VOC family protein [Solirubrobacteraceae bacterium]
MQLDGMHHITMITGDAQRNVDFYAGVLGLRLVKKTVNFDAPEAYHLYFGDEQGSPGSLLTWFEFAGAQPGRAGAGMIHTIQLGVTTEESLGFWEQRLGEHGYSSERTAGALSFADHDGLRLELVVADPQNPPLQARYAPVPAEHAITGVEGARAYVGRPLDADQQLLTETLGFATTATPGSYRLQGPTRGFGWTYEPTDRHGIQGAGTVHHIAWHSPDADHVPWQQRVGAAGMQVTPVIDRDYFNAIYFRQPQGILFEIATTSPGFATDEDAAHLGEELRLPRQHEHLRPQLEKLLVPLRNPRAATTPTEA